jgi:hypothetical protein
MISIHPRTRTEATRTEATRTGEKGTGGTRTATTTGRVPVLTGGGSEPLSP